MRYFVITEWDVEGRGIKWRECASLSTANDLLSSIQGPHPGAFVAQMEQGWSDDWQVVDGALVINPRSTALQTIVVTPRQARLALLSAGLLDSLESELAAPENRAAKITWEYALEVRSDDPLVGTFATILGLSDEQVRDLFETAAGL